MYSGIDQFICKFINTKNYWKIEKEIVREVALGG